MTPPKDSRIDAAYMRCSTVDQGLKYGLDRQREAIDRDARREDMPITEWFTDLESGSSENRKEFLRLQKMVAQGQVRSVRVLCADRFGRDTEYALRVAKQFVKHGTMLKFVETPVDIQTPMGMLAFTQYLAFAAWELALIKGRSVNGRERKMAKGQPDSWMLPYGLAVKDGFPIAIPEQGAAVRKVYEWRREGKSYHEIRDLLLKSNWKTARGGAWPASLIRRILSSRAYIGEYHRCGHVWPILDKDGKLIVTVNPALFEEVRRIHHSLRLRTVGRPTMKRDYLLRGMVWCGHPNCGRRALCINVKDGKKYYHYYLCGGARCQRGQVPSRLCTARKNPAERLEQIVWTEIWRLLRDPARLRKLALALAQEEEAGVKGEYDPRVELEAAREHETRLLKMVEKGLYTVEVGQEKIKPLRDKIARLEVEARELNHTIEIAPLSDIERTCRRVASGPEPDDYEGRRSILEGLQELRVRVADGHARIIGKVPIAAASNGKKNCTHGLGRLPDSLARTSNYSVLSLPVSGRQGHG